MDVITRRQQNWIGHILGVNSLPRKIMEGRKEGKRGRERPRQMVKHRLDDGGWIRETEGKGTTSRRVESLDI